MWWFMQITLSIKYMYIFIFSLLYLSCSDHQRDTGAVSVFMKLQAEWITGNADTSVTFELEQYKWPRSGLIR